MFGRAGVGVAPEGGQGWLGVRMGPMPSLAYIRPPTPRDTCRPPWARGAMVAAAAKSSEPKPAPPLY
jgi:hypothetical protein